MTTLTEADVEAAALAWLAGLGWGVAHGPRLSGRGAGRLRPGGVQGCDADAPLSKRSYGLQ